MILVTVSRLDQDSLDRYFESMWDVRFAAFDASVFSTLSSFF